MIEHKCQHCGYIYSPEKGNPRGGIYTGIKFEDIPDYWVCPQCGKSKEQFKKIEICY